VWHRFALDKVHFSNEGFNISYSEGLQRGKTRNRVAYPDASGKLKSFEIGDQTPLVLQGYRFYTSPNKGFAPTFLWQPTNGQPVLGTVHLPSYPINEYRQSRDWVLPGSTLSLWTMLQFDEVILDPDKPSEFRLPEKHKLVVRVGELRRELQSGESMELPQGKLVYQGLRSWMGYTVFYDWTIYWLLASCVLAIGAMAWYFWTKYFSHPWNE
jgi:cytochrome c biogenesis protein